MSRRDEFNPASSEIPFDNQSNGFNSENAQDAIEEAKSLGAEASRGGFVCGHAGRASSGRWLSFFSNNPSNDNPLIAAEPGRIRALSLISSSNSTGVATIYVNGVSVDTLSLSASRKASKKNLSHVLTDLDEISVRVTSGSISRPNVYIFIQTF